MTTSSRLRRLEQRSRPAAPPAVRVFWNEEVRPCTEHPRCDVELATALHHRDVVHLTWEVPRQ